MQGGNTSADMTQTGIYDLHRSSLLNILYQEAWMLKWSTVFSLVLLWNLVICLRKVIKI